MQKSSLYPGSAVLLPFLALALAGCGGQEKFANSETPLSNNGLDAGVADTAGGKVVEPPSKPGKYGGKLTDSALGDPKTFNLWVSGDAGSTGALSPLYSQLIERNAYTLEWESALAELPIVSKDGLTWTFQMKEGLKWSDGAPLTADDVIFTLDVIYDTKVQTNMHEGMILDAPDGKGGYKRVPLKYKKVGKNSVEFVFPVAYAPARDILSFPIAPRHKLEGFWKKGQPSETGFNPAWGVDVNVKELVASGPWIITSFVPGQRIVYGRNPNYWKKDEQGKPLPYLDQYVTLIVPDTNTITIKFLGGETDATSVTQADYKQVKAKETEGNFKVYNLGPTTSTNFLGFNMNMRSKPAKENPELFKLFNDVKFRQAVSHAVDREKIVRNVFDGLAQPGYGPESPANKTFYSPDVPRFEYNLDTSRRLLAEIGLKDSNGDGFLEMPSGKPLKFSILTNVENKARVDQGTILTADLKAVGIDATFTPIAFNSLLGRIDNKPEEGKPYPPFDWQAIVLGFTGGIEPNNGKNVWRSEGNFHQWDPYQKKPAREWEARIDELYRTGAQEMDEVKRKAIYAEFQKIVGEQQPFIYTVVPDALVALREKYGNVKPCSLGGVTWNLEELYSLEATRNQP